MKSGKKSTALRWIRRLALLVGGVVALGLVATIIVVAPEQIATTTAPDPLAYFHARQPPASEIAEPQQHPVDSQAPATPQPEPLEIPAEPQPDAFAEIKARHAALWVIRRDAFLPFPDVSKVPPDLRELAETLNAGMRDRLTSITVALRVPEEPQYVEMKDRGAPPPKEMLLAFTVRNWFFHPGAAAWRENASRLPEQADYLNPEMQQAWIDLKLRTSNLLDFRVMGRPHMHHGFRFNGVELRISDTFSPWAVPDTADLPADVRDTIADWEAVLAEISASLLEAPTAFRDLPYRQTSRRLNGIGQAYQRALADFSPRFVENDEFIIVPKGIDPWFETQAKAKLAAFVAQENWLRAAWTCRDDLDDNRQFAYYMKKMGMKGRWLLAQNTVEKKASNWAKHIEDSVEEVAHALLR